MKNIRFLSALLVSTAVIPIAFLVALTGCTPSAIPTDKQDAQNAVDSMVFVKNTKTGLCFGIISSQSVTSSGGSTSMSATNVPCDKVQDQLK